MVERPRLWVFSVMLLGLLAGGTGGVRADSVVVFNEIMYHPPSNEAALEWVELHNQMAVNVDLSRWSLSGGIDFAFPEGTVIPGQGYLVIASSPVDLMAVTGLTNVLGPFQGRLANNGERLELRNNNQRLMDRVTYGVEGDWPVAPDGSGFRSPNAGECRQRTCGEVDNERRGGRHPGAAEFHPALYETTQTTRCFWMPLGV